MLSDELYQLAIREPFPTAEAAIRERIETMARKTIGSINTKARTDAIIISESKRAINIWKSVVQRLRKEHHPMGDLLQENGIEKLLTKYLDAPGLTFKTMQEYYH